MEVLVFKTLEDQARGLQHLERIDPDTLYFFPNVPSDVEFHSRNVPEPFDIAFLTDQYFVLALVRMNPPGATVRTPEGCAMAVEARAGNLERWGFTPGRDMSPVEG